MSDLIPPALARSLAAVTDTYDTPQALGVLVSDCASIYPAGGVAVLGGAERGLSPLSASSHTELELELLQLQLEDGPCLEAFRTQRLVWSPESDMVRRWPRFARAVLAAGYRGVHAYPMGWRGQPVGGLNVFVADTTAPSADQRVVGRLYADLASLTVADPGRPSAAEVTVGVRMAVHARATVERAKGVLAVTEGLDLASAHERLLELAIQSGTPLGQVAAQLLERAAEDRPDGPRP